MLIESIPPRNTDFLSLARKNSKEINGKQEYGKHHKKIDPTYRSNFN
jgi:hypothetical protein